MTDVDAFFAEIRLSPKFVEAASADPEWLNVMSKFERDVDEVLRRAGDSPEWLDYYDNILAIIRSDVSLKEKLAGIVVPLTAIRDGGRTVN